MTNGLMALALCANLWGAGFDVQTNYCTVQGEPTFETVVEIVTNVTTEVGVACDGCALTWETLQGYEITRGHDVDGCPEKRVPRNTKIETTTVVEIKTLKVLWEDDEHVIKKERVLSSKIRRWIFKPGWVEE